jgi:hypothetical protein
VTEFCISKNNGAVVAERGDESSRPPFALSVP